MNEMHKNSNFKAIRISGDLSRISKWLIFMQKTQFRNKIVALRFLKETQKIMKIASFQVNKKYPLFLLINITLFLYKVFPKKKKFH